MAKRWALAILALLSFLSPLVERIVTGRVEMLSTFGLVEAALGLVVLFWWYHVDKAEHGYRAGPLMNGGVLVLAIVALPIYFIRSRGWKRGAITTGLAALFFVATLALAELGEWLGARLA
jgi:hypothetical protein